MGVIILLIITGFILLFLEFFVVPGISIPGIVGFVLTAIAIYIGYADYGVFGGTIVLVSVILFFAVLFIISLRTKTWKKLELNTNIESKIDTIDDEKIKPGDRGITISRINPMGKVRINGIDAEAECPGKFLDQKTEIEVVAIDGNKLIIKTI